MKLLSLLALMGLAASNYIKFYNNCPYTVWPGILGMPGKGQPEGGGFALEARKTHIINVASNWAGRIWPRTHCDRSGHCKTGDCNNRIKCNGTGGFPPCSLVEISLFGPGGLDFYDVSLIDGFNVPIKIEPTDGFHKRDGGRYDCKAAGCYADLNSNPFISNFRYRSLCLNTICPKQLAVKSGRNTIACMSACFKFNTDEYCCRGASSSPQVCNGTLWPINYPAIFERACPGAYSYPYDDRSSIFTCQGNPSTNYRVVFCP
uniref:Pathogenesis-related protein 5 n=3 Tax=Lygus hesperus TaxID=30085 RepID=A0A0K8SA10_LYGHE